MILQLLAVQIICLFLVSGLFAQAKVGSGPQFLLMSPSVRGIAMGQTAVTSYDSRSYYFNPGTLALMDIQRSAFSFNPISTTLDELGSIKVKTHTETASFRLIESPWGSGSFSLAFGYMFTTYSIGPIIETTPSFPQGTGRVVDFIDRTHSFSIASGYKGSFEFGLGTTVRYMKEDIFDVHADGVGFDIGTIFRFPLFGSLSNHDFDRSGTRLAVRAGASVTNVGSSLYGNSGTGFGGNPRRVPVFPPLPRRGRLGLGLDFASGFVSLSPVIELTVANNDERGDLRLGVEAGLFSTVFFRAGRIDENDDDFSKGFSETSYGFGLSTKGIREFSAESARGETNRKKDFFEYLSKNLNLTFSFAHLNSDRLAFDDPNYYQIEITL